VRNRVSVLHDPNGNIKYNKCEFPLCISLYTAPYLIALRAGGGPSLEGVAVRVEKGMEAYLTRPSKKGSIDNPKTLKAQFISLYL
jgi:hypothetical protein